MKTSWLSIASTESEEGHFEFVHHTTSNVIELHRVTEAGHVLETLNMTYEQWEDLCGLIKRINLD